MNYAFLVWKGLTRKKVRTGLTWLSVFIAFLMFGLLSAMNDLFSGRLVEGNFSERLIVQSTYGLPLPLAYYEKIRAIEGVAADQVVYNSHIGGYYQERENRFFQNAVNAESYLRMQARYYDLPEAQKQAWLKDKTGVVIGRELADRFGWKVGDRVPVISSIHPRADGQPWMFNIRGIMEPKREGLRAAFMALHFDYMAQSMNDKYEVFWYTVNVEDPRRADEVAQRIDAEFRNSARPTSTQTLASLASQFASQFGNFGLITSLILAAVFFTMLLVTGNTMMQAFRERIHELAVLKAVGFPSVVVLALVLAESASLVLLGGLPGIGVLWFSQDWLQTWLNGLYIRPAVIAQAAGLMLVMGLLVGLIPAVNAGRLTVVEALRRR